MYTVTQAARALVYQTATAADLGHANRKDCAAAILYAAEHSTQIALDAIQVYRLSVLAYGHLLLSCAQQPRQTLPGRPTLGSAAAFAVQSAVQAQLDKNVLSHRLGACAWPLCNLQCGMQILGGNGYINEYPTGRLLRDAKLYEIGAGTSEIRRMLIGRELFKEHA